MIFILRGALERPGKHLLIPELTAKTMKTNFQRQFPRRSLWCIWTMKIYWHKATFLRVTIQSRIWKVKILFNQKIILFFLYPHFECLKLDTASLEHALPLITWRSTYCSLRKTQFAIILNVPISLSAFSAQQIKEPQSSPQCLFHSLLHSWTQGLTACPAYMKLWVCSQHPPTPTHIISYSYLINHRAVSFIS